MGKRSLQALGLGQPADGAGTPKARVLFSATVLSLGMLFLF